MSAYTKGPWHWVGQNYIDGPNGESVLECGDDGKDWGLHSARLLVSDADRALMAAAPEMKRALDIAEGRLMCLDNMNHPAIPRNDDVLEVIRAALAKALGDSA